MFSTLPPKALQLPAEIWDYICSNLSQQDLRNLRLVCIHLQTPPTISLFETIYLKVSLESFNRLKIISEHPVFSNYVRRISYDRRIINDAYLRSGQEKWARSFQYWGMREKYNTLSEKEQENVYLALKTQVSGQEYIRREENEREMLQRALARLPCLYSIYVESLKLPLDRASGSMEDFSPSNSILRTTFTALDLLPILSSEHSFCNLLEATTLANPRVSEVSGLRLNLPAWNHLGDRPLLLFKRLPGLQRLTLEFVSIPYYSTLPQVLIQLSSLEHLRLSFGEMDLDESMITSSSRPHILDEKIYWRKLRSLSLHAVPTTGRHLQGFLRKHSDSLRSLVLENMRLYSPRIFNPEPDSRHKDFISWIDLIQFLHEEMTLHTVKFCGSLYNCGNERWSVSDTNVPSEGDCLKYKIERYITHNGLSPFTSTESKNTHFIDAKEHDIERHWLSWQWTEDASWMLEEARNPGYTCIT